MILNPLGPAMLSVQTANVLGWDLQSRIESRNREQGRRNEKKTILCRNGSQKLHLNSVDFSPNRCDITRCVKRCVLWDKNFSALLRLLQNVESCIFSLTILYYLPNLYFFSVGSCYG